MKAWKISCLRSSTLLKKRLWHKCFPVNFAKFLRTPFSYRTIPVTAKKIVLHEQEHTKTTPKIPGNEVLEVLKSKIFFASSDLVLLRFWETQIINFNFVHIFTITLFSSIVSKIVSLFYLTIFVWLYEKMYVWQCM